MIWGMKKYTQLTTAQREIIYLHLEGGKSLREIGKVLGRSHRTIGREIKRNGHSSPFTDKLIYSPSRAQRLVKQRREEGRLSKLESDQALRRFVIGKLNRGWSPEQIAGRLKLKGPADPPSYETIYQFVYARENKALRLWEFLRRGHKKGDRSKVIVEPNLIKTLEYQAGSSLRKGLKRQTRERNLVISRPMTLKA